jgi:beta-lactamase superfamily II metal-dependent hydrolase
MNIKKYNWIALLMALVLMLCGCSEADIDKLRDVNASTTGTTVTSTSDTTATTAAEGVLTVNYIDVGQADSILITSPDGKHMLIDAGETKSNAVVDYLTASGVTKLDVAVATHPHSDHINAMDNVLNAFPTDCFYMPNATHTTKDYERMITALDSVADVVQAKAGESFKLGEYVNCDILAPIGDSYDNLNNYSVVIKMTYGSNSFLFTGDAEKEVESEILASGADVSADVLKCGHHGSSTSTSQAYLKAVSPSIAVISCGKDNDYGHPHKETLASLSSAGVTVLRTDEMGTITLVSDGTTITSSTGDTAVASTTNTAVDTADTNAATANTADDTETYIGNKNSKVYHRSSCASLPKESNRVTLTKAEAESGGYTACGVCKP